MFGLHIAIAITFWICAALAKPRNYRIEHAHEFDYDEQSIQLRKRSAVVKRAGVLSPKVFVLSMFTPEANVWYSNYPEILAQNITVPGFSPLFPNVHCTTTGEVCQLTTGEGEINAASTISALMLSTSFNLTSTYFLIAGIGGVNPHVATTGSVTFARYAVQLDLQHVFAESQIPGNDSSGWFPQGADYPDSPSAYDYPTEIYGTEVYELNDNLRKRFVGVAKTRKLNDTTAAAAYRAKYGYAPASQPPAIVECDSGTSNNYWSGSVLGDAFTNYTLLMTNGTGIYCNSQQEDNASLEALIRGAAMQKIDFGRVVIMRTASDFDRAPPGEDEVFHLLYAAQGGFLPSINNIFIAGSAIVEDVLQYWDVIYRGGIAPGNYVGDLFNRLKSSFPPDIGTPGIYIR